MRSFLTSATIFIATLVAIGGAASAESDWPDNAYLSRITSQTNACYLHYLGSTDINAFYKAPMHTRAHVLDCIELYGRTGRFPSSANVETLQSKYETGDKAADFAKRNSQQIQVAVQAAHRGLEDQLKDPSSVRFGPNDGSGNSFNSDGTLYAVCGTLNAKNSFGGYVGNQAWVYVLSKNVVYTQETGLTKAMVLRDCTGKVRS